MMPLRNKSPVRRWGMLMRALLVRVPALVLLGVEGGWVRLGMGLVMEMEMGEREWMLGEGGLRLPSWWVLRQHQRPCRGKPDRRRRGIQGRVGVYG